jgi:CBS-domain-containing membrane protein
VIAPSAKTVLYCSACIFDRAQFLAILAGGVGGGIAIASMEAFSITTAFPLGAIPCATSIVTVLGSPKAEPAQPRALIGGHLIFTLIGLLIVKLFKPTVRSVRAARREHYGQMVDQSPARIGSGSATGKCRAVR